MECSISGTSAKGIDRNESDFSVIDSVNGTKEGSVIDTLEECTASVNPDVLVIALGIDERGELLGRLCLSEILLIIKVNVGCHFYFFYIIINYISF
jgi:hypothetical protein